MQQTMQPQTRPRMVRDRRRWNAFSGRATGMTYALETLATNTMWNAVAGALKETITSASRRIIPAGRAGRCSPGSTSGRATRSTTERAVFHPNVHAVNSGPRSPDSSSWRAGLSTGSATRAGSAIRAGSARLDAEPTRLGFLELWGQRGPWNGQRGAGGDRRAKNGDAPGWDGRSSHRTTWFRNVDFW